LPSKTTQKNKTTTTNISHQKCIKSTFWHGIASKSQKLINTKPSSPAAEKTFQLPRGIGRVGVRRDEELVVPADRVVSFQQFQHKSTMEF
jgi:hypothetical protein